MPKASDVLEQAIKILKPEGQWCQGELHLKDGEKIKAHCAVGGIHAVTRNVSVVQGMHSWDGSPYYFIKEGLAPRRGYRQAEKLAKKYLADEARKELIKDVKKSSKDLFPEEIVYEIEDVEVMGDETAIVNFNDHDEIGNQKSVLAAFRRALKKAKAEGN